MRITEAAHYIGLSKSYVYKLVSEKRIPHYKPMDGTLYFRQEELESFIFRRRVATDYELNDMAEKMLGAER
jgi:excisionase family DNA binding protein